MGSLFVVPMLHPANVFHGNRRWRGLMNHAFGRAAGLARGTWRPKWNDDNYIFRPTLEDVRAFCRAARGARVGFDIETDGRHHRICDVRCIGLYDGRRGVGICVPLLYRDGSTDTIETVSAKGRVTKRTVRRWVEFYPADVRKAILKELEGLLSDPNTDIVTQNGQFDRATVKAREGLRVRPGFETIVAHHIVAPFLRHGLDMLGSLYTHMPYYKETEEGEAWSSTTDDELWLYCIRDCKVTFLAAEVLRQELQERPRNSEIIYPHDRRMELLCQGWWERGIAVDQEALGHLQALYRGRAEEALRRLRATVQQHVPEDRLADLLDAFRHHEEDEEGCLRPVLRPRSLPELRMALDALGIPLTALTPTGEISTERDFLLEARMELLEARVPPDDPRIAFLDYLFAYRENDKVDGTFLCPELIDGRVHPSFSVHVVPTGRLCSSGPNFQNQPKEIRGIFVADDEDSVLVAGDWDSGELRLGGYLSGEPILLKAFHAYDFEGGPKVHKINAYKIFNVNAHTLTDPIYRAAKAFIYGAFYGAGWKTSYETCRKEMPDLLPSDFRRIYESTVKTYAVFFGWQRKLVQETTRRGYMDSCILERRRYFFEGAAEDSPEAAAMMNNPFQAGLADVVGLANFAVIDELEPKYRKRGWSVEEAQRAQVHDELLFSVPKKDAEEFSADFKRVAEASTRRYKPDWHMPVDVKCSRRWAPLPWEKKKDEDAKAWKKRLAKELPAAFLARVGLA